MTTTTTVWVEHRFAGYHSWPDAPEARSYLASPHRHLFHVRAGLRVDHDDREVEFHDLLDVVAASCRVVGTDGLDGARRLGSMSCEQIAKWVIRDVKRAFGDLRNVFCSVSEDGEAGATVEEG